MQEKSDWLRLKFLERFMHVTEEQFLLIDRERKIVDISDSYYASLKLSQFKSKDELIGLNVEEVFYNSKLPSLLQEKEPVQYNMELFQPGATLILNEEKYSFCLRTCANILDEKGEVIGAFAHVHSTEQAQVMNQLVQDMEKEVRFYRRQLQKFTNAAFSPNEIIGVSPAIMRAKNSILRAAATNFSVLITGETGTGKEMFASALHNASPRRDKPFIKLNCSAIPPELFESELFGYEDGAFTGAKKGGKKGKFELANGGTIFLDEIADMPMGMQAKLLRVLQEQEIDRVGSTSVVKIDVRVIAATNKDLIQCIQDNTFRADLYYRLNVINILVPPLRERREDIADIAEHFLRQLNEQYSTEKYFSNEAICALQKKDWPGNVRELRNEVERMFAFSEERIGAEIVLRSKEPEEPAAPPTQAAPYVPIPLAERLQAVEKAAILEALTQNDFNFRKTAQDLGISRGTLYNKTIFYGITRPE